VAAEWGYWVKDQMVQKVLVPFLAESHREVVVDQVVLMAETQKGLADFMVAELVEQTLE
jgi:hypothetical protein